MILSLPWEAIDVFIGKYLDIFGNHPYLMANPPPNVELFIHQLLVKCWRMVSILFIFQEDSASPLAKVNQTFSKESRYFLMRSFIPAKIALKVLKPQSNQILA